MHAKEGLRFESLEATLILKNMLIFFVPDRPKFVVFNFIDHYCVMLPRYFVMLYGGDFQLPRVLIILNGVLTVKPSVELLTGEFIFLSVCKPKYYMNREYIGLHSSSAGK